MGILDRIIRGIVGVALMVVALFVLDGAWQIVLIVLGGILVGTALSGFLPDICSVSHFNQKIACFNIDNLLSLLILFISCIYRY